jgi:hypothetical protein
MEGTAAKISMAVPNGLLKDVGQISVKNTAIPKLRGTAINKAMIEVITVP